MSQFNINIHRKGLRQKFLEKALRVAFPDCIVSVTKYEPPTSRADRFSEAESAFENAKSIVEELKDELREWHDALPESLQNADKGTTVGESADALENLSSELDGISFEAPEFPSMY